MFGRYTYPSLFMVYSLMSNSNYRLLRNVQGYENRLNDIVLFSNSLATKTVYYFGGDIQDLPDRMKDREYYRWNLVSTGEILCRKFRDATLAIIRPKEMKDGIFSRYSNFLPSTTEYGDPISYDTTNFLALHQLRSIDEQIFDEKNCEPTSRSSKDITLVGFSKGCVVLNQFLSELTSFRLQNLDIDLMSFISRIRKIIWLDGGHNNGQRTMIWPTDENLLSTLSYYQIEIEIYVTPFQIDASNPHKKYHREQYEQLSKYLSSSNHSIHYQNKLFFSNQLSSIDKHFDLLTVF